MHESPLKVLFNRNNKYIIFLKSARFALFQKSKVQNLHFLDQQKIVYGILLSDDEVQRFGKQ